MIFVGLGMLPSANKREEIDQIGGPGPNAYNRVGSFIGPISASFQVNPPDAPGKGDLETTEIYGRREPSPRDPLLVKLEHGTLAVVPF